MTPIDLIDGRHEELVAALPPLSAKYGAVRLLAHLRELPPLREAPQTVFYHVDTLRRLCASILQPIPISGHPGFLRDLVDTLSSYCGNPAAGRIQHLHPAIDRLLLLLAAERAVRGQWSEVSMVIPDMGPSAETSTDLAAFLDELTQRPAAQGLHWPFHLRDPAACVGKGDILTVLVDSPSVPTGYREAYLARLSVQVIAHTRRLDEPHMVRSRDESGEDLALDDRLKDIAREATDCALRLLGPNIARRAERCRFDIDLSLKHPAPVATVQGRSIMLPLVLVLAEALSDQLNLPFAIRPNRSIVWTGDVDEHGAVATIGDIDLKTARVLASRAEGFAVPTIVQSTVEESLSDGASRALTVSGITALADVPARPALARIPGRSLPTRIATITRRNARPLGISGVGAAAALLVALAFVLYNLASWLDTIPASARIADAGARVEVLNSRERVLKRFRSPMPVSTPPCWGDVDGDGNPEVLLGTAPDDSLAGMLFCVDMDGHELWRFSGGFPDTSTRPFPLVNSFGSAGSYVHDLDHDGQAEIVAAFNHRSSYAGHLAVLDNSGTWLGSFWNPGHIISEPSGEGYSGIVFADLDDDGFDEIMASATNNSCGRATLIILDPRGLSGIGFNCRDSTVSPCWQSYVLFPEFSKIVAAMGSRRFETTGLRVDKGTGRRVLKLGLRTIIPDLGQITALHYLLASDLQILDVYFGDHFVAWAQKARRAGLLDISFGSPELQAEVKQIDIIPGPSELLTR